MNDLILHPITRQQLDDFISLPSHAVVLVGPTGGGKHSLAFGLAEAILRLPAGGLSDYPYQLVIGPEGSKSIGIEAIRQLEHFLSLKVPSKTVHNRVVIVDDAHLLTIEAQNALLKTLEEPPEGTLIILTTRNDQALLPTIRSRVQSISVKRVETAEAMAYFQARDFDSKTIKQAYTMSGGLMGLMGALLQETDHPLVLAAEQARQLLSQPTYERLLAVDELSRQHSLALDTTFILQQMAHVSLQTATGNAAIKWQNVLNASYKASEALASNAQPKLVLTKLMLSF
jgi:replication-associated recombination protein RarA